MRSKRVIYNISTNIILQLITIIYGFIVPSIIISNYGSKINGLISSITQFLAYISLLESGFGPVVKAILYRPIANKNMQEIAKILSASEKFFKKIAIIFIIYIIILLIAYPYLVANDFSHLFSASMIGIISISTFAEYYFGMTYRLFLQSEQKTYVISLIQILTYIVAIFAVVICSKLGASIQIVKLTTAIVFTLRPIFQNFYVKRKYKLNIDKKNSQYEIKNKWDGLSQHIAAVIHGNTDVAILTIFSSLTDVSIYSVYYMVLNGVKMLVNTLSNGIDSSFGDMIAQKEQKNLNEKFSLYEIIFFSFSTIIISCTLLLITPFISVYTKSITDAHYIRPLFGYLFTISQFIWVIRLPYSSIILAAGHFKETRVGAWIECCTNLIISILLVNYYGLIGVAIGTIVAMTIRTCEFVYHTNKYILKRSISDSCKKIFIMLLNLFVIIAFFIIFPLKDVNSYIEWIINAIYVFVFSLIIVIINCFLFYKKKCVDIYILIKNVLKKQKNKF